MGETEKRLAEIIDRNERNGVLVTIPGWREHDMTATVIRWSPGDPNALAHAIINNVQGETELILDGNRFFVRRA
jgi:hypothetical protein